MGLFHGFWTLLLLIMFVGIVVWAWSAKRKKHFDTAARIPLEDEHVAPSRDKDHVEWTDG